MLEKQEVLQVDVNAARADIMPSRVQSDSYEISAQRSVMLEARGDLDAAQNQMRDWQRNIPTLAADFEFDVEQVSANIAVLNEQNSDIKADIICLEEEKKTLQLLSDLEDARVEDAETEVELLRKKEKHVMQELTDFIERGDTLYSELRKVVTE